MLNLTCLNFAKTQMNYLLRRLLLVGLLLACTGIAATAQTIKPSSSARNKFTPLAEGFYFFMNDYKMEHQGEANTLNIKVSYEYNAGITDQQYPDFIPIRKDLDAFLREYPNETTFWEIVNKQLTEMILKKYPAIASVICEIQVTPSPKYQFTRGSVVTRHRTKTAEAGASRQNPRRGQ